MGFLIRWSAGDPPSPMFIQDPPPTILQDPSSHLKFFLLLQDPPYPPRSSLSSKILLLFQDPPPIIFQCLPIYPQASHLKISNLRIVLDDFVSVHLLFQYLSKILFQKRLPSGRSLRLCACNHDLFG